MKSKLIILLYISLAVLLSSCGTRMEQPSTPLASSINSLMSSEEIRIWTNLGADGFCDPKTGYSTPIRDKEIIKKLAIWIKEKPYLYDEKTTLALRDGNAIGSLAVGIKLPDDSMLTIDCVSLFCGSPITAYTVPENEYYEIEEILRSAGYKEK